MENEAFGGAHREGGLRVCVCLRVCVGGGGRGEGGVRGGGCWGGWVGGGGLHTGVLHTALFFFF